jgi:predicted nucleic acid-binding protein
MPRNIHSFEERPPRIAYVGRNLVCALKVVCNERLWEKVAKYPLISVDQTMLSLNLMKKYGIFPRDAIHASCAIASRIENVITTDSDFKRIEELEVYICNY